MSQVSSRSWGGLVDPATGAVRKDAVDAFFDRFDADGSSSLSAPELEQLILSMGTEHVGGIPSKQEAQVCESVKPTSQPTNKSESFSHNKSCPQQA
jgi:hypothetical protein